MIDIYGMVFPTCNGKKRALLHNSEELHIIKPER